MRTPSKPSPCVGIRTCSDYSPFGVELDGRTVSVEEYRFGFQNQEMDDEIKGEGNSINYTFRMHDPRLGRFFAVDKLASKNPEFSNYQFSGNCVILMIDAHGLDPEPVTSWEFRRIAKGIGLTNNNQIGRLFENLTLGIVQETHSVSTYGKNYYSEERNNLNGGLPSSVRPDGIQFDRGIEFKNNGYKYSISLYLTGHWYEAKVTNKILSFKYRKHQLAGMIDVLAELKSDDDEIPALTLLTTSNTIVGRDLCKYAEDRGVRLYQSVLYYDEETDEYMLSDPELKVSGVSFSKILENFSNWFTNYDNFDFFGKKDSAFLESMVTDYSSPSDPDPAKAE
jgi:RHS repeat-associated protein